MHIYIDKAPSLLYSAVYFKIPSLSFQSLPQTSDKEEKLMNSGTGRRDRKSGRVLKIGEDRVVYYLLYIKLIRRDIDNNHVKNKLNLFNYIIMWKS